LSKAKAQAAERIGLLKGAAQYWLLYPRYVAGLRALLTVHDLELYLVAFLQALITVIVDGAVMDEHVWTAILTSDKAKTFCIIEPLHGPFQSHVLLPPGQSPTASHPEDAGLDLRPSGRPESQGQKDNFPWNRRMAR
jgi:hypothetical protein